jgi:hypothetical protein
MSLADELNWRPATELARLFAAKPSARSSCCEAALKQLSGSTLSLSVNFIRASNAAGQ